MTFTPTLRTFVSIAAITTGAFTFVSNRLGAQLARIPSEVSCASCRIQRDSVVTLGAPNGDGLDNFITAVTRSADGHSFVATMSAAEIAVFDPSGRFVGNIGRAGEGPGEFRRVTKIIADADRDVHVFDARLVRHSIFRRDGTLVRATGLPITRLRDATILRDGSIVINGGTYDRASAGFALTQLDTAERIVRRADEVTRLTARTEWILERSLSLGQKTGQLVVAHPNEFVIDLYDAKLQRVNRLERVAAWFEAPSPENPERSDGSSDVPPTSRVLTAWEDVTGLIWIVALVRSPEWQPRTLRPGERLAPDSPLAARPRYETVIEVIDGAAKRVLARERSVRKGHFSDGYEWQVLEAADGTQRLVGWRLRLQR